MGKGLTHSNSTEEIRMTQDEVFNSLVNIVGEEFVSSRPEELYYYSLDSGAQPPRKVDYVVMPKTVEEVQKVIILANERKIPITPMGGGFTTSGLAVPVKGGMVMDMKRMDKIIEVNEKNSYAIVEAGASEGALKGYLQKHYPHLQHSIPEAPPTVTIAGNSLIQGHGHITPRHGINSDTINGLEVVIPTGEICKIGSCSLSPYWFSKGPLPDLLGLFVGWLGTTGIVTKISIQLFPKPRYRDVVSFVTDDVDLIPDVIFYVAQLDMMENFFIWGQEKPDYMDHVWFTIIISGQSEGELKLKKQAHKKLFAKYKQCKWIEEMPPALRERCLDVPPFAATAADFRKGGGWQYTGAILPIDKAAQAWRKGIEIPHKYGWLYSVTIQVLTGGHSIMCAFQYSFNRAEEKEFEKARKAVDDSNKVTLDLGGIVWRPTVSAQNLMLQKMDASTFELMRKVKKTLDPNNIMNPGNWEN
jgi:glycolate oxidase